jgi:hypothetical protein
MQTLISLFDLPLLDCMFQDFVDICCLGFGSRVHHDPIGRLNIFPLSSSLVGTVSPATLAILHSRSSHDRITIKHVPMLIMTDDNVWPFFCLFLLISCYP